jgi:hypothetical protein
MDECIVESRNSSPSSGSSAPKGADTGVTVMTADKIK